MSEHGAPATVVQGQKDSVLVSIPMVGFPPGFQLRPGEKVMVMVEGSDLVARPLVEMAVVNESVEDLAASGKIDISGRPHVLQPATALGKSDHPKQGAVVFVVDPGSAPGPKQIVAARPR